MEWKLPDGVDRMAVNAALETLTEEWNLEAARLVVRAFHGLPATQESRYAAHVVYREHTLHTDDDGVAIETAEDKYIHYGTGNAEQKARIGRFVIFRTAYALKNLAGILFQDFRGDEREGIEGEAVFPRWTLGFHETLKEPLVFFRLTYAPCALGFWQRVQFLWICLRTGRRFTATCWEQKSEMVWTALK